MPLTRIPNERRRLSNEAYDQILQAIWAREIGPQDTLVQERLAAEMQISRTPVREALLRLEQEGVLKASRRGSFRLCVLGTAEIRELYQARAAIEGQTARTLAAIVTSDMASELKAEIEQLETEDTEQTAHRAIHRSFVERAGNRYLLQMFDMVWSKGLAFQLFSDGPDRAGHQKLVDVLEGGDRNAALAAFSAHIQDGFDRHMDTLAKTDTP